MAEKFPQRTLITEPLFLNFERFPSEMRMDGQTSFTRPTRYASSLALANLSSPKSIALWASLPLAMGSGQDKYSDGY
jgi:hypothetical protein